MIDEHILLSFSDEVSAFNGLKKAKIANKGMMNNKISALLFTYLESHSIPTHFQLLVDAYSQSVRKLAMIPLEIIIRNIAAGPWLENLGFQEGAELSEPIIELRYKSSKLSDPLLNESIILAMGICSEKTLTKVICLSKTINQALTQRFLNCDIKLVDLKLEFGLNPDGDLFLADSLTPDTMRLWDGVDNKPLDKDVFRKDLGKLEESYAVILSRLEASL